MLNVDTEDREQLKQTLIDREKLLWTGRPKTGLMLHASDIYVIPFSIVWLGFLLFSDGDDLFKSINFFKIPFLCFGLYFLIGRFFWNSKERKHITYGVTTTRILIKSGVFFEEIKSYDIKSFSNIELSLKKDGYGTIELNDGGFLNRIGMKPNWEPPTPQLDMIENPNEVYSLLLKLKNNNAEVF